SSLTGRRRHPTSPPFPYTTLFRSEEGPYRSTERRVSARSAPLSATELEAAIKNRKAVQTPFDQTQGAMYTIKRDSALRNLDAIQDRKSTRLNSSHEWISYAVFCLI